MTELEERLRIELTRSADVMRPGPDPMVRLLAHRRRRRQRRWAGTLAATLALALTGTAALTAGGPSPTPTPPPVGPAPQLMLHSEITSQWTRQLLAAPTRGSLAGDTALIGDLTRQLAGRQRQWTVPAQLNQIKVLLLADVAGARMYMAAFYNDTHAMYVSSSGPAGSTTAQLANGEFGGHVEGLRPFSVSAEGADLPGRPAYRYVVALAPPACQIASSRTARFTSTGTVDRTWIDEGSFVIRPGQDLTPWWRFTCDGVVRDVEPGMSGVPTPATLDGPHVAERGQADPALVTRALQEWRALPGLAVSRYRVLWGGTPPGATAPTVVVAGESPGGVQLCALTGTAAQTVLASAIAGGPLDHSGGVAATEPVAAVTTAVAPSTTLTAVRLPDPANPYLLSDRLLILAPPAATELRFTGAPQPVPLTGGVAVITAKPSANLTLRATDKNGTTLAQLQLTEPDADGLLLGQPLLQRW